MEDLVADPVSQSFRGPYGNDGDRNIVDSVDYITSKIWADESGRDYIGAVAILDEQIFTARDVQKADARPGGYIATGGHGGIIGRMGNPVYHSSRLRQSSGIPTTRW